MWPTGISRWELVFLLIAVRLKRPSTSICEGDESQRDHKPKKSHVQEVFEGPDRAGHQKIWRGLFIGAKAGEGSHGRFPRSMYRARRF